MMIEYRTIDLKHCGGICAMLILNRELYNRASTLTDA